MRSFGFILNECNFLEMQISAKVVKTHEITINYIIPDFILENQIRDSLNKFLSTSLNVLSSSHWGHAERGGQADGVLCMVGQVFDLRCPLQSPVVSWEFLRGLGDSQAVGLGSSSLLQGPAAQIPPWTCSSILPLETCRVRRPSCRSTAWSLLFRIWFKYLLF